MDAAPDFAGHLVPRALTRDTADSYASSSPPLVVRSFSSRMNVDVSDLSLGVGAPKGGHVVPLARAGDAAAGRSGRSKLRAYFVQGDYVQSRLMFLFYSG